MAVNFQSLLSKPVDQIKEPAPLPAGTYTGSIKSYKYDESREKKTPYVRFEIGLTGPGADISPDEVAEIDLTKKVMRRDYYLTEDALFRLKQLFDTCGIDYAGRSLAEVIPDLVHAEVLVAITTRSSEDGKKIYFDVADLKGTAA